MSFRYFAVSSTVHSPSHGVLPPPRRLEMPVALGAASVLLACPHAIAGPSPSMDSTVREGMLTCSLASQLHYTEERQHGIACSKSQYSHPARFVNIFGKLCHRASAGHDPSLLAIPETIRSRVRRRSNRCSQLSEIDMRCR